MKRFEVGKTYQVKDHLDPRIVWSFTVEKRSEKLVTLSRKTKHGEKSDERIVIRSGYYDSEICMPLGSHPLFPIIDSVKPP